MPHDLNVVLVEPEIPSNTGSIGRLCLATGSRLHLIKPLGFEITDTRLKRAGLDYWQYLKVTVHEDWPAFLGTLPAGAPLAFFSRKAARSLFDHRFEAGSYLVFGKETRGLGEDIVAENRDRTLCLPQYDSRVRSLNLANAVSVALYEAIRQLGP